MSHEHRLYLRAIKRKTQLITLARYLLLIFLIGFWELAARLGWIDPFITSSPSRFLATIGSLYRSGELFLHIGVTLYETIAGFVLGTVFGTLLAVLLWWSPPPCQLSYYGRMGS